MQAQISTKVNVNLLHSRMHMCRKLNLCITWEILHAGFQRKGWAPKREETGRNERSELGNIQKPLLMERFQRIPVNMLEGKPFTARKGNVFLRVCSVPDIFLHLMFQHQQVSGKAIKNSMFVHIQHSVWEILFAPTTTEFAFSSPDVSSGKPTLFCFSYCRVG